MLSPPEPREGEQQISRICRIASRQPVLLRTLQQSAVSQLLHGMSCPVS
jgi:hypothetical protein